MDTGNGAGAAPAGPAASAVAPATHLAMNHADLSAKPPQPPNGSLGHHKRRSQTSLEDGSVAKRPRGAGDTFAGPHSSSANGNGNGTSTNGHARDHPRAPDQPNGNGATTTSPLDLLASTAVAPQVPSSPAPARRRSSLPGVLPGSLVSASAASIERTFPSPFAPPAAPAVYPGTNALPVPQPYLPNRTASPDSPLSLATIASSAAREKLEMAIQSLVGSLQTLLAEYDSSLSAELASWQTALRSREAAMKVLQQKFEAKTSECDGLRREIERLRALAGMPLQGNDGQPGQGFASGSGSGSISSAGPPSGRLSASLSPPPHGLSSMSLPVINAYPADEAPRVES